MRCGAGLMRSCAFELPSLEQIKRLLALSCRVSAASSKRRTTELRHSSRGCPMRISSAFCAVPSRKWSYPGASSWTRTTWTKPLSASTAAPSDAPAGVKAPATPGVGGFDCRAGYRSHHRAPATALSTAFSTNSVSSLSSSLNTLPENGRNCGMKLPCRRHSEASPYNAKPRTRLASTVRLPCLQSKLWRPKPSVV